TDLGTRYCFSNGGRVVLEGHGALVILVGPAQAQCAALTTSPPGATMAFKNGAGGIVAMTKLESDGMKITCGSGETALLRGCGEITRDLLSVDLNRCTPGVGR